MLKVFFAVLFFVVLYLLAAPLVVKFIPTVIIKIPTVSVEANRLMQMLDISDNCDPLKCSNIYVFYSSEELTSQILNICATNDLTTNVKFIPYLKRLGTIRDCSYIEQFSCMPNSIVVKLSVYSLIPYPQKVHDYYHCK